MKNTVIAIVAACILIGCTTSHERAWLEAQRNLVPEAGILAEYDSYDYKVRTLFAKGYSRGIVFRMVCRPSFTPEWLVGVRKANGGYSAFVLRPQEHIWKTELVPMYESGQITEIVMDDSGASVSRIATNDISRLKREVPQDFRKIPVEEQSCALDPHISELLARCWSRMLLGSRHPRQSSLGCDGTTYHFSMRVRERGIVSGRALSPSPQSQTGLLSSLGELLATYIEAPKEEKMEILGQIKTRAELLERMLPKQAQPRGVPARRITEKELQDLLLSLEDKNPQPEN